MKAKIINLIVLLIVGSINAFSQISEDKKKQIQNQYDMVYWSTIDDGYIRVKKHEKIGVLDLKGNEIFPCLYEQVFKPTKRNYYEVTTNGKVGVLDKNGNIIFSCQYDKIFMPAGKDFFEVTQNRKVGIFDDKGKQILPCQYDKIVQPIGEDYFEVTLNGKVGIVENTGNQIIPCQYDKIFNSIHGAYFEVTSNKKVGALDTNGRQIFPCLYDKVFYNDDNDYYEVTLNGKVGMLDNKGKQIFPCLYEKIHLNKNFAYYEVTYNGKVGVFDLKGDKIFDFKYTDIYWWETKYLIGCEVKQGDKTGFITKAGKELIPCIYDEINYSPTSDQDYYANVTINGKTGIYDVNKGKEIVPCTYTYIRTSNYEKIAYICMGGKYIPLSYEQGKRTGNYFEQNGKWGCYDLVNERYIIPCKYDYVESAGENLFQYNLGGKVRDPYKKPIGGLWGVANSNGKILFNAEYTEISSFKDGVAKAVKDGTASILVNPNSGTKLLLANGISTCAIDKNIPTTNRQNEEAFVFIFANENYKNCPSADFSINDGKVFEKYCNQTLGIPETNIKYYEDATFGNIQSALKKIQDIADVYDGDAKIIFYYSGLGNTVEEERYILPSDASLASVKTTGISVNNILQVLNALNTKYTLALFDAPFNGTDKSGKLLESARGIRVKSKAPNLTGKTIAVFGSSDDKNNYCDKDKGHSLLTYNFLEQIQKSKGETPIKVLIDNTISNVGKFSLKEFNDIQMPQLIISEDINNNWQSIKF